MFTQDDGQVEDKVVLSYGLWQRRYSADPAIVGKKIQLNDRPYTVLGVMPAAFQYPNREFALWTPLSLNPQEPRTTFDYGCIARLKNGVTVGEAHAQISAIQARIGTDYPAVRNLKIDMLPMLNSVVGNVRTPLYVLMGAVLCLLLIGCANLANLLVARSMTRSHELVVRAALGARTGRLVLQSIMEVAPLVVLGGICGLVFTRWMLSLLLPLLPSTMPRLEAIRIDWQVLVFAVVVLFATAVGTGIWPALQATGWNVTDALRESGRTTSSGGGASRLRSTLVVSQIAAVVVLMVVSALLIRSFVALRNVDPGFRSDNILSVHFALSDKYLTNPNFGQDPEAHSGPRVCASRRRLCGDGQSTSTRRRESDRFARVRGQHRRPSGWSLPRLANGHTRLLPHTRHRVGRGPVFHRIGRGRPPACRHRRRPTRSSRVAESERDRQAIPVSRPGTVDRSRRRGPPHPARWTRYRSASTGVLELSTAGTTEDGPGGSHQSGPAIARGQRHGGFSRNRSRPADSTTFVR